MSSQSMPFQTSPTVDSETKMRIWRSLIQPLFKRFLDWQSIPSLQKELLEISASHGAEDFPTDLADALRDLDEVRDEAREEGFPEPSEPAVDNAGRLLRRMFAISRRRYEIYPTPDGEVALDAPDGRGQSVLLLCASAGGVQCLVDAKTGHRRAAYAAAAVLPDGFLDEALAELDAPAP